MATAKKISVDAAAAIGAVLFIIKEHKCHRHMVADTRESLKF